MIDLGRIGYFIFGNKVTAMPITGVVVLRGFAKLGWDEVDTKGEVKSYYTFGTSVIIEEELVFGTMQDLINSLTDPLANDPS